VHNIDLQAAHRAATSRLPQIHQLSLNSQAAQISNNRARKFKPPALQDKGSNLSGDQKQDQG